jgi:hypothetical protein
MNTSSSGGKPFRIAIGRTVCALALAALFGAAALPARAENDDNNGWRGRGHQEARHDDRRDNRDAYRWREREWHDDHPNVYVAPGYYAYAPPPVVYAPPPVPPSLNFIFPLGR